LGFPLGSEPAIGILIRLLRRGTGNVEKADLLCLCICNRRAGCERLEVKVTERFAVRTFGSCAPDIVSAV
jgi:hypothetical protein